MHLNNPFKNSGKNLFIGRRSWIRDIEEVFFNSWPFDNLALVGCPHVGKRHIVNFLLERHKDSMNTKNIITIYVRDNIKNEFQFFLNLVNETHALLSNKIQHDQFLNAYAEVIDPKQRIWEDFCPNMERYFAIVEKSGYKILFVIENFDATKDIFKEKAYAFQELSQLSSDSKFKIKFITLSRRPISEIEKLISGVTVSYQRNCHEAFLGLFDDDDMIDYYNVFEEDNIILDDNHKAKIDHYAGKHPFFLCKVGEYIFEQLNQKKNFDIDDYFDKEYRRLVTHYESILGILEKRNMLNIFIKICTTNEVTLTNARNQIKDLIDYDLIRLKDNGYAAYSDHFQDYLLAGRAETQHEQNPLRIYISHVGADRPFLREMEKGIAFLIRSKKVIIAHFDNISPGTDIESQRQKEIFRADIIYLLLSADYMADDSAMVELELAMKQQEEVNKVVIPIRCGPCDLGESKLYKIAGFPADNRTLKQLNQTEIDDLFLQVANDIKSRIEKRYIN